MKLVSVVAAVAVVVLLAFLVDSPQLFALCHPSLSGSATAILPSVQIPMVVALCVRLV